MTTLPHGDYGAIHQAERQRLVAAFEHAHCTGRIEILTPLPHAVRLRLWLTRRINNTGYWLVCHDHIRMAQCLWRACRMW